MNPSHPKCSKGVSQGVAKHDMALNLVINIQEMRKVVGMLMLWEKPMEAAGIGRHATSFSVYTLASKCRILNLNLVEVGSL